MNSKDILKPNRKVKVAIFGGGFVGFTTYQALSKVSGYDICLYDQNKQQCRAFKKGKDVNFVSIGEAKKSDIIFVCLPTPMDMNTGECHLGIVEETIQKIRKQSTATIIIKSTIPPGTTQKLCLEYGNVLFNPEFLTEKSPYLDFISQDYQFLGVPKKSHSEIKTDKYTPLILLKDFLETFGYPREHAKIMSSTTAEMVKYTRNCYLATRISFFNEIKLACDSLEIDFKDVAYWVGFDKRIGNHYNKVEYPYGFGGHCLPKDVNALKSLLKLRNVDTTILDAVWEKNLKVRKDKDWEKMENRAVIKLKRD